MYEFAKARARHSVITFFVGLVFIDSFGLAENIEHLLLLKNGRSEVIRIWMLTALYHDWAYHSSDITKTDLDYKRVVSNYLLRDNYDSASKLSCLYNFEELYSAAMAYSYKEIEAYDRYARKYHLAETTDTEKLDHGILGGIKIFDRLSKRIVKNQSIGCADNETELVLAKISCITIAQHNIYKSNSEECDMLYGPQLTKLHSYSDFVIGLNTPLLLLLSLVDTFECVKRFGKSRNEREYLQTDTVLGSIMISVEREIITVDYSNLEAHIKRNKDDELAKCLNGCIETLCGIDRWTAFSADNTDSNKVTIKLDTNRRAQ